MANNTGEKVFPRCGEVWLGQVDSADANAHEYIGKHPYLVTSNNKFNKKSGIINVIPFTSKRFNKPSPAHVNFAASQIEGLLVDSTLMCENETSIKLSQCVKKLGKLSDAQLEKVACSIVLQKPLMAYVTKTGVQESSIYKSLVNYF